METQKRPFGVTVLAILAGLAAILAVIHFIQSLGILPYKIGPFNAHVFSFWNALMWALMIWVWGWLVQMLWKVAPQAWLFLAVITVFNLVFDFALMLGSAEWSDLGMSIIVNALILAYVMLPGTRRAFKQ
jgi:hypothetical protein